MHDGRDEKVTQRLLSPYPQCHRPIPEPSIQNLKPIPCYCDPSEAGLPWPCLILPCHLVSLCNLPCFLPPRPPLDNRFNPARHLLFAPHSRYNNYTATIQQLYNTLVHHLTHLWQERSTHPYGPRAISNNFEWAVET
jgi:hypothetical protein